MPDTYALRGLTFLWPAMFWLLLAVPLLVLLYRRMISRRRQADLRYAGLVVTAAGASPAARRLSAWRQTLDDHTPAILLLLGLTALIAAVARPQAVIVLPSRVDAIILALDARAACAPRT